MKYIHYYLLTFNMLFKQSIKVGETYGTELKSEQFKRISREQSDVLLSAAEFAAAEQHCSCGGIYGTRNNIACAVLFLLYLGNMCRTRSYFRSHISL